MLGFFRRHQQILFLFTTVIIVISFVFFGTYETLNNQPSSTDKVVYTTPGGEGIYQSELEEMVLFMKSDALDSLMLGGAPGVNFLNDGVIRSDFINRGLARELLLRYKEELVEEFKVRRDRERRYEPYRHHQAVFLSAEAVWGYLAPEIPASLATLKAERDPLSEAGIDARIALYLAESNFPGGALRQVLKTQEAQQEWIRPDPALDRTDLSLFGYHSAEDWFGTRFLHLAAEFVFDAAEKAEAEGFTVTDEEAYAELVRNTQLSYARLGERSGSPNSSMHFRSQLQRMGITQTQAVRLWRKVLLFRRYFQATSSNVFVDRQTYEELNAFTKEGVELNIYEFPEELKLKRYEDLQALETYISMVADRDGWSSDSPLALPAKYLSPRELLEESPELMQKRYLCRVKSVDQAALEGRVAIRDMWQWQQENRNWELLSKKYPELRQSAASDAEARLEAIDALPQKTRAEVDRFARKEIVASHPEWVEEGLISTDAEMMQLAVRLRGGSLQLQGVEDRAALVKMLDEQERIERYSPDGRHHYSIEVLDRSGDWEMLTFVDASSDGTMSKLARERLEKHYKKIRSGNVRAYRDDEGNWRPLDQVKTQVADNLYSGILREIKEEYRELGGEQEKMEERTGAFWARQRMLYPLRKVLDRVQANPEDETLFQASAVVVDEGALPAPAKVGEQWRLAKRKGIVRRDVEGEIPVESTLAMEEGEWSNVSPLEKGTPLFFQVQGPSIDETAIEQMMLEGQQRLAHEAEQAMFRTLLAEIEEKAPLKLDHLFKG